MHELEYRIKRPYLGRVTTPFFMRQLLDSFVFETQNDVIVVRGTVDSVSG